MTKMLATLGILAVGGALALCDLCGSGAARSAAPAHARLQAGAKTSVQPATATRTITLAVKGMTCGGCVVGTRRVLTRLPGVVKAAVSYEKGTAIVTYDPRKATVEQMIAAIKTLGYIATPRAN